MSRQKSISPTLRKILSIPSAANLDRFDPWTSSSTGHQRAENPYSGIGWREARTQKLATQFGNKASGGRRERDGEWKWVTPEEMEDKSRKAAKNKDIRSFFGSKKSRNGGDQDERRKIDSGLLMSPGVSVTATRCDGNYRAEERDRPTSNSNIPNIIHEQMVCGYVAARRDRTGKRVGQSLPSEDDSTFLDLTPQELDTSIPPSSQPVQSSTGKTEGIFSDLTIYINGSTFPLISDHKLKNILAENGANISIHLARRSVTHVILGRPNSRSENLGVAGAGGGLAARKLQREIQRVSGKGVKYVGVEWVLESVKAGRRLPEARFANLHMASGNQRSVLEHFSF